MALCSFLLDGEGGEWGGTCGRGVEQAFGNVAQQGGDDGLEQYVELRRAQTLAILDVGKNELRIQATDVSWRSACLWSNESKAILQEEHLRLIRYDVAHDQSEVLFSVDEID